MGYSLKKEGAYKNYNTLVTYILIVVNALIAFIAIFLSQNAASILIAILSMISTICSGTRLYNNWGEKSIRYRKYIELVKHELFNFSLKTQCSSLSPEDIENEEREFSNKLEELIMLENQEWQSTPKTKGIAN